MTPTIQLLIGISMKNKNMIKFTIHVKRSSICAQPQLSGSNNLGDILLPSEVEKREMDI